MQVHVRFDRGGPLSGMIPGCRPGWVVEPCGSRDLWPG